MIQNRATFARLDAAPRNTVVLNHALFVDVPPVRWRRGGRHVLAVGGLESRKGFKLAIRAMADAPEEVHLLVLGDGPERAELERLAERLGVAHRVEFRGAVPRDTVLELLTEAVAVLFTGVREEGGLALAEAMTIGAPVVVLANGGAGEIAARATDPSRALLVQPEGVQATARAIGAAITRLYRDPPRGEGPLLDRAAAVRELRGALETALGQHVG